MRTMFALALILAVGTAIAAERSDIQSSITGNNATVKGEGWTLDLMWKETVIPGGEILLTKKEEERYGFTTILRYKFRGVFADALVVDIDGGTGQGEVRSSESFRDTLYIERAPDSVFYFAPQELYALGADYGVFKITRSASKPWVYEVSLEQRGKQ